MKALVITIPRDRWPADMTNHWHIVDTHISRHLVTAVQSNYKEGIVTEYEWSGEPPKCLECDEHLK